MRIPSFTALAMVLAACQPSIPPTPQVHIDDARARPSRGMMMGADASAADMTSAVYLTLRNEGTGADTLVGASTEVARAAEIHESRMDEGVMRMRQVPYVAIPAGESVALKPGGLHIMLIGLGHDLAVGDEFSIALELAQSGERTVAVVVRQSE